MEIAIIDLNGLLNKASINISKQIDTSVVEITKRGDKPKVGVCTVLTVRNKEGAVGAPCR